MRDTKKIALIIITGIVLASNALAAWNLNIPEDKLPDLERMAIQAAQAGPINVSGVQTIAEEGQCSFVSVTVVGEFTGDTDDGGGLDSLTCELWDDGTMKDSETLTVPVGSTAELTFNLSFEGLFGTSAPGVGVLCPEVSFTEDPFFPVDVAGNCPSEQTSAIPVLPPAGLLLLTTLIGLLGAGALYTHKRRI